MNIIKFKILFIINSCFIIIIIFLHYRRTINIDYNNNLNTYKDTLGDYSFEFYYTKYLCSFFILENEKNCSKEILNNYDFFYNIKEIRRDVNLLIDFKKSLIENIFLIVGIIPFLKFNSSIEYQITNKESNKLYKLLFSKKNKKQNKFKIDINDFETIKNKFNQLINNIWEFPLSNKKILDNIRYIINNYYNQSNTLLFEEILIKNYDYYISKNIKAFSDSDLSDLISKLLSH